MSTLLSLRSTVSSNLLRDPNNKIRPVAFVDSAINNAYIRTQQDCLDMYEDWEKQTTISSIPWTQEYTLPSDFLRLQLIRFDWSTLQRTTKKEIKEKNELMTWWIPTYYYIYQGKIWLFPVPDKGWTVDIEYTSQLPTITVDQDSLNPWYLDMAICYYAASECSDQVGKYDQSAIYRQRYKEEVNNAMLFLVWDANLYYR